jgi:hypothetical protein
VDPDRQKLEGYAALILILLIGLLGIILILWLLRAWKRHQDRLLRREPRVPDDMPDMWRAGGERLTAKLSPYPRPGGHPPDENAWQDEDENDDNWAEDEDEDDDDDDGWDPESDADDDDDDEPWRKT